jgi:hypothetical protein
MNIGEHEDNEPESPTEGLGDDSSVSIWLGSASSEKDSGGSTPFAV